MKLIKKPSWECDTIDTTATICGGTQHIAGKSDLSDVGILVPDKILTNNDDASNTWYTLQHGPMPDLYEAMYYGKKIDSIHFPDDGIILRGVVPLNMERSEIFKGRIFRCRIDSFEEQPK